MSMLAEIILKMGYWLLKPFPKVATEENDTIRFWRDTIFYYSTIIYSYIGFVVLIISVYESYHDHLILLVYLDLIFYAVALGIMLTNRYAIETKCRLLSVIIYLIGISVLLFTGPYGAGLLWLFMFPVFVGILLGIRPARNALILNLVTLILLSFGLHTGHFHRLRFSEFSERDWLVVLLNFVLVNFATTTALTVIIRGMQKSIKLQHTIQQQLNEEKNRLEMARFAAEENNREKSMLLANLSHEFRTPMNAILGFSTLLKTKKYPPEKQTLFFNIILEKGNYLLQLVNDLIDYSKIEAGQIHLYIEPCKLDPFFEELEVFYQEEAARTDRKDFEVRFVKSDQCSPGILNTDVTRLKQIMINLLSNAMKFTQQGSVQFGYDICNENSIRLFVRDTGIGIDATDQTKIFYRFEQLLKNPQPNIQGHGLGLHITKYLVELMNGKVWVESELNKGSCFYVQLPYHSSDRPV